jgi:hypothetical protein
MEFEPIKDIDGDLLHIGYLAHAEWAPQYNNTITMEIEMVSCNGGPVLYFEAEQLRNLAKKLVEAADFLDAKGY